MRLNLTQGLFMFSNPSFKLPSNMEHNFSKVPSVQLPRSTFDRSSKHLTTFDAGYLIPYYVDEALPGDTFQMKAMSIGRLATPINPTMDNLIIDTFFFEVPNRILQDNFVKIHGERANPADSIDFLSPKVDLTDGVDEGSLYDYLGYPTGDVYGTDTAKMPNNYSARAYNLIYNDHFRDQNLQDSIVVDLDDGVDDALDYVLRRRGKRHDYFTSALPSPQKGDAVSLPLGTSAPVSWDGIPNTDNVGLLNSINSNTTEMYESSSVGGVTTNDSSASNGLYADLTGATAATINELRLAFQTQRVLEKDARGGTRFIEMLKSHFGVTSPDFRLQRPSYLGGSSTSVNISQVPQTSSTDSTTPQGNMSAYGTFSLQTNFVKSFTEHAIIMGIINVRADLTYQQGLNRMHSRSSRYDWYLPTFAHIGEQAVLNKEIYHQGTAEDDAVFGYQEAWAEYRYKPSIVTGAFRSNSLAPLDSWHYAQDFDSLPALNASFIEDNPPIERTIAVQDEPHIICDTYFNLKCTRVMPIYSVPGMIDHF